MVNAKKAPPKAPRATFAHSGGLVGGPIAVQTRDGEVVRGTLDLLGGQPRGKESVLAAKIRAADGSVTVVFDDELKSAPIGPSVLAAQSARTAVNSRSIRRDPQVITIPAGTTDAGLIARLLNLDAEGADRLLANTYGVVIETTSGRTLAEVPDTAFADGEDDGDKGIRPEVDVPEIASLVEPEALAHANALVNEAVAAEAAASPATGGCIVACSECGGEVDLPDWPAPDAIVKCAPCQEREDKAIQSAEIKQRGSSVKRSAAAPAPVASPLKSFSKKDQTRQGAPKAPTAKSGTRQKVGA